MNNKISQLITTVSGISAILYSVFIIDRNRLFFLLIALISGIILILFPVIINYLKKNLLKVKKQTEDKFYRSLDFSKINKILIIGHTGKEIYTRVHFQLEKLVKAGKDIPTEISILIRSPYIEGSFRNDYIRDTINKTTSLQQDFAYRHNGKYKNNKIDIRHYEAIPSIRGVLCQLKNNDSICFLSSYYWLENRKSKAYDFGYRIYYKFKPKYFSENLFESWFNYYWGNDEIHTIVFDFDATLVDSINIQIKAWIDVINSLVNNGNIKLNNLSDEIINNFQTEEELASAIKKIYIKKQYADNIIKEIFVNLSDNQLININKKRYAFREKLMYKTRFFEDAINTLFELSKNYNLAIVSSTGERMISNYLSEYGHAKGNIRNLFSIILGKFDPVLTLKHENIEHKAFLLQKISSLTGIPLSRVLLIGDNNSDYLAAKQLGVDFIECRASASSLKVESLIDKKIINDYSNHSFFNNYKELPQKLDKVSINKQKQKYNYYQTATNNG